jgi:uncharacterized protein involved in outer membrane biogenesis
MVFIAVIVVVLLILGFIKDMLAKTAVEKGVEMVTGLQLQMGGLSIGLMRTLVDVDNLLLFNPVGYKDRVMINIPDIYVDYDLGALLKKNIHLNEVRLDLREITVVKNEQGDLNLDSLKVVKEGKEKKPAKKEPKEKAEMPEIKIDKLQLKIGKLVYKDYSSGKADVKEFKLGIDETYENIDDPKALVSLILMKAIQKAAIQNLINIDLGNLQEMIPQDLQAVTEIAGETAAEAQEAIKGSTEAAGQAAQDVQKAVEETTKSLKGLIEAPFGGE